MADAASIADTRICVILRVRPPNKQEEQWFKSGEFKPILRDASQTPNPDKTIIQDASGKEYNFDKVFRIEVKQVTIFREAALATLENVFKGYCGAIMAYGQTGTGKTHTMQGYDRTSDGDERGIIPRCSDYIFARAAKETGYKFTISISAVQIYLDKLQDLFQPEAPELNITPDTERVEMPGLTEKVVTGTTEFMKLFYYGEAHRVTRATLMNPTSSRGHAALIVNIKMEPHDVSMSTRVGKLVLVDLAGYERFALTGITTGIAAEEAKKINASLLALGGVVNSLADKQKHVPYRNAKLTRLLRDCLGGTSKSTIVLTIGPCDRYKQETAGTLYFGFRAMAVKVDARIKEIYDPTKYIQLLKEKLAECSKTMNKIVKYMKEKGKYDGYVQMFGAPEIPEAAEFDDNDEEADIMAAMAREMTAQGPAKAGSTGGGGRTVRAADMIDVYDDEDPDAPEDLRKVRQEWNQELMEQQKAAENELETLHLRHLQDLEEARKAGASEEVLAKLRAQHQDELGMLKEQNQTLRTEILRQKAKDEAKALLTNAVEHQGDVLGGKPAAKQDNSRINEMVSHLQETCESKDEVLVRLFDLICLRESELKDLEQNVTAIAAAMAPADAGDTASLKSENTRLKAEIVRREQHIEALKGMISGGAPPAGVSPQRQLSPAANRPAPGPGQPVRQPAPTGATTTTTRYAPGGAAPAARPTGPGFGAPGGPPGGASSPARQAVSPGVRPPGSYGAAAPLAKPAPGGYASPAAGPRY